MATVRIEKNKFKIICAAVMCTFSLIVTVTGVLAWFSAQTHVNNESNNFTVLQTDSAVNSISVHDFYGSTSDGSEFGFNPTPSHTITWSDHYGNASQSSFSIGTYSMSDPHHPVLFLFGVNGSSENLRLITEYSYVANSEPVSSVTVATYSALGTYANNTLIKVTSDENHRGASTVYKYVIPDDGSPYFDMQWIDLKQNNNPLSSIIQSHYILFTDSPLDNSGTNQTKTGNLMVDNGQGVKIPSSRTYVPILTNSLTDQNKAGFVEFDSSWNPTFNKSISLYNGSIQGYSHIGIIFDYNLESLEYIYSFFLGHNYLNSSLGFSCDWKMEV